MSIHSTGTVRMAVQHYGLSIRYQRARRSGKVQYKTEDHSGSEGRVVPSVLQ